MSQQSIERLQEDLAVLKQAAGFASPFGREDLWFFSALSLAGLQFAVCHHFGILLGISIAPLALIAAAYLGWMLLKSRRRADVEFARRREYRSTIVALLVVVPVTLFFRLWGEEIGLTKMQQIGATLVVAGSALTAVGAGGRWQLIYPRSYYLVSGLELVAFGLLLPFGTAEQTTSLLGLCLAVAFGSLAWIMSRHLRGQRQEMGRG